MRFARYHRIVVDVYSLQHPERSGRSAKSFAAHLTGLSAWLEDEAGAQSVNAAVQRWLSGPSPIEKPALPPSYGAVTIRALVDADDPVKIRPGSAPLRALDLGRVRRAARHRPQVGLDRGGRSLADERASVLLVVHPRPKSGQDRVMSTQPS